MPGSEHVLREKRRGQRLQRKKVYPTTEKGKTVPIQGLGSVYWRTGKKLSQRSAKEKRCTRSAGRGGKKKKDNRFITIGNCAGEFLGTPSQKEGRPEPRLPPGDKYRGKGSRKCVLQ